LNSQYLRAKDDLVRREGDINDLKRKLEEQNKGKWLCIEEASAAYLMSNCIRRDPEAE